MPLLSSIFEEIFGMQNNNADKTDRVGDFFEWLGGVLARALITVAYIAMAAFFVQRIWNDTLVIVVPTLQHITYMGSIQLCLLSMFLIGAGLINR